MALITFFASLVIALLSGLGVGGGGLFVIYLALFTSTPQLLAQGLNLIFFLFSSSASLCIHLFRRKIYSGAIFIMISVGVVGAVIGSLLSKMINEDILRKIFGLIVAVSGFFSLFGRKKEQKEEKSSINI